MSPFARVGVLAVPLLLTLAPTAVAQSTDTEAEAERFACRRALAFTTRPQVVDDGKIFVFSGGNASALDARTGDVLWN